MRRSVHLHRVLSFLVLAAAAGCGGSDAKCDPEANTGCTAGLVCEVTRGSGDPICAKPVVLHGKVVDLVNPKAIAGARVVGLDGSGAPVSSVAVSGAAGEYELAVPSERNADGSPVATTVTLRADAAGYQSFPGGVRVAQPISTAGPVEANGKLVVQSAQTDVGLLPIPGGAGTGSIAGKVAVPASRNGTLVVAESGGKGVSAIADVTGAYQIFNLAPGDWTVKAYAAGANHDPATVTVAAAQTATANLALSSRPTSQVTGSVDLVNPGAGQATSVVLVVESTFNEALARGENPPGLRAPSPGTAPNVAGAFAIAGVPEGRYVVLAGFENDFLVRDPDVGIGGTAIVHIAVASGADTAAGAFKVTGSLDIMSPGKDAPEAVTGKPTLRWKDDSSEDLYHITVFDSFGTVKWEKDEMKHTGSDPAVPYEGPLDKGMYYQFRVASIKTTGGTRTISLTEDLRGVFYMP